MSPENIKYSLSTITITNALHTHLPPPPPPRRHPFRLRSHGRRRTTRLLLGRQGTHVPGALSPTSILVFGGPLRGWEMLHVGNENTLLYVQLERRVLSVRKEKKGRKDSVCT